MSNPSLEATFAKGRDLATALESGQSAENAELSKEADRLIKEAASFEKSKSENSKKITKIALGFAGAMLVLALAEAFAIASMMPLKQIELMVLEVNKITGESQLRTPGKEKVVSISEEVDKFWIEEYVRAREGYDWGLATNNYNKVKAYSENNSSVFNEYDIFIKSPKSPLVILNDKARVVISVNSTTLNADTDTATVRFSKTVYGQDGKPSSIIPPSFWIATLRYEYPNPKMKDSERKLNPQGMKIPSYQLVQEQFKE